MAVVAHKLATNIFSHAWSHDATLLAVCPNNNEVHIYSMDSETGGLSKLTILSEHEQLVSGIDWNDKFQLVTCSHDRNSYVWTREGNTWQPELVMARMSRAALCVKWSRDGIKFAVGTGACSLSINYFDEANHWWASKVIRKKHSSSVTSVGWHPSGLVVATASTDAHCRIFNAHIPGCDGDQLQGSSFGDVLMDVDLGSGWLHSVCWSPSGCQLACAAHGSCVVVFPEIDIHSSASLQKADFQEVEFSCLPFKSCVFVSEDMLVAAGFDGEPWLMVKDQQGDWLAGMTLAGEVGGTAVNLQHRLCSEFMDKVNVFRRHRQAASSCSGAPSSVGPHQNLILELQAFNDTSKQPTGWFSSAGVDGMVVLWDVSQQISM